MEVSVIRAPEYILMCSMLDPTIGVLGLARQSVAAGCGEQQQLTEAQAHEQNLTMCEMPSSARKETISGFVGNSVSTSAVVVGPVPSNDLRFYRRAFSIM